MKQEMSEMIPEMRKLEPGSETVTPEVSLTDRKLLNTTGSDSYPTGSMKYDTGSDYI